MGIVIGLTCWIGMAQEEDRITITLDRRKKIVMEFVRIKAGKFRMGSDFDSDAKPQHEVTITKDFWMQTTETTQAQWDAVMGKNPSKCRGADLPVEFVSWDECQEFVKQLGEKAKRYLQKYKKEAGLPTEAEWEYACLAGLTLDSWNQEGVDPTKAKKEYAWFWNNSDEKTHPVGQKKANAWGLYDTWGNVAEWCEDRYGKYPSDPAGDPTGPSKGDLRVIRGGNYKGYTTQIGARRRAWMVPTGGDDGVGLRVALR